MIGAEQWFERRKATRLTYEEGDCFYERLCANV